jgi:3-deoxy-D-manno-octulosonic-acid transferase
LRDVYSLGLVIFVGGSLVPGGGHNLVEAASRGKPVLFGPDIEKRREVAEYFVEQGFGFFVTGTEDLSEKIRRFLDNPELTFELGRKAKEVVRGEERILDYYSERIKKYIQ